MLPALHAEILNSKSEIPNKPRNNKIQKLKRTPFRIYDLKFRYCFEFRASCFEFPCATQAHPACAGRGFPIRTSTDQSLQGSSPSLIAAGHVLHRLSKSRHPPYALDFLLGNLKTTIIIIFNFLPVYPAPLSLMTLFNYRK